MDDDVYTYVDRFNSNFTHYDISTLVHKVFKNNYRYMGGRRWEYLDLSDQTWKHDLKSRRLATDIKVIISDLFVQRALYWYDKSQEITNIDSEIHSKIMSEKMLKASVKLKNQTFISTVIKEARSFFDFNND
jgi:hypothetical protein